MADGLPDPPIERSYWLTPSIAAGVYPGSKTEAEMTDKVRGLLGAGVTLFLDLTEPGELDPYDHLLGPTGEALGCEARWHRIPVVDVTPPSPAQVVEALELIDSEVAAGGIVYVHCWGGKGRTGSILGCHLARELGGRAALAQLNDIRRPQMTNWRDLAEVPETAAQRALVLGWGRRRRTADDRPGVQPETRRRS